MGSLFAADVNYTGISGGEWATIVAPTDVNLDNNAIPTTSGPITPNTGSYWQGGSYPAEGDTAILKYHRQSQRRNAE